MAYGLTSSRVPDAGTSTPTRVGADEKRNMPWNASAAGIGVRKDVSFVEATLRWKLMPQICDGPVR